MDDLLGIDLIDCAGDNLAAIAPMVIFPASADKRVVTRYGEVTSASFARPGSATYVAASGEVGQVGVDVPRVGSTGWILEGSATNKCACAKSNPQDLTNITKAGDAAAVLSVVDDAAALAAAGLSAFGPNVYKLDNRLGTTNAYAVCAGVTGNANPHSLSVYARGSGNIGLTWSGSSVNANPWTGTDGYLRKKSENSVSGRDPASADCLAIKAFLGSIVYFTLPQLEEGPVCTSPIPGGTGAITRASEGADTSGNGLSIPLSRAMRDSLTGELSDWTAAWSHVSGTAPTYSGGNKILTYSTQTSTDYHALLPAGVSVGDEIEVGYSISGLTGGVFQLGFGAGSTGEARSANGAYTERGTLTTNTNLYAKATGLTGSVTINYVRRVLESGQTNPGEGTLLQAVDLPWDSSALATNPSGVYAPIVTAGDATAARYLLCIFRNPSGLIRFPIASDGVSYPTIQLEFSAGRYCLINQWSAALGKMRVGLYNPTTDVLTWSSPTLAGATPYRGLFPIHASNRLRFFYGGGAYPIHVGGLRWLNSIVSDAECVRLSKEMLP